MGQLQISQEKVLLKNVTAAILPNGDFNLSLVKKVSLNQELKKFKSEAGSINYSLIRDIPKNERIFAMSKADLLGTIQLISVALKLANEQMNMSRPMNNSQILDLAEMIVDESEQDNLSFEDVLLFLQKLTRGEYGSFYESMDIPKFFTFFNKYRDERWNEMIIIRDKLIEEHKSLGDDNSFERSTRVSPLGEDLARYASKLQKQSDELKLLKREKREGK